MRRRRLAPQRLALNPDPFPLRQKQNKQKTTKQSQRLKHADPTRASTAVLSLFVARLLAGGASAGLLVDVGLPVEHGGVRYNALLPPEEEGNGA